MSNKLLAVLLSLLLMAGCARPEPVRPALWQVDGPKGERAWLFGTIHALPRPVAWKSDKVGKAMQGANVLVLEVAAILDDSKTAEAFTRLAQSPNLPPLAARVPEDLRDELAYELGQSGYRRGEFDHYETWAAMLAIQQAISARGDAESGNGIDRAVVRDWNGRVDELEGAQAQLRIFDTLPETQQQALLAATLRGSARARDKSRRLQEAWATGDVAAIDKALQNDFAGQPALRTALLTRRNEAWAAKLDQAMRAGARPFVAVGAGHLAGTDSLPAMLALRGYTVTRLQ